MYFLYGDVIANWTCYRNRCSCQLLIATPIVCTNQWISQGYFYTHVHSTWILTTLPTCIFPSPVFSIHSYLPSSLIIPLPFSSHFYFLPRFHTLGKACDTWLFVSHFFTLMWWPPFPSTLQFCPCFFFKNFYSGFEIYHFMLSWASKFLVRNLIFFWCVYNCFGPFRDFSVPLVIVYDYDVERFFSGHVPLVSKSSLYLDVHNFHKIEEIISFMRWESLRCL